MDNEFLQRKPIRLSEYDYSLPGAYFVTVCTANRMEIFWDAVGADIIRPQNVPLSSIGKIAEQAILQVKDYYKCITVDQYCIMPDHIHLILYIQPNNGGQMISAPTSPNARFRSKRRRIWNFYLLPNKRCWIGAGYAVTSFM